MQCVSCEVRTGIYIPENGILQSHRREPRISHFQMYRIPEHLILPLDGG
jgi:hypothetical protein